MSEEASRHYKGYVIEPFIPSRNLWSMHFNEYGLPLIGSIAKCKRFANQLIEEAKAREEFCKRAKCD